MAALGLAILAGPALAQVIAPQAVLVEDAAPAPPLPLQGAVAQEVAQADPRAATVQRWPLASASALLAVIEGIGAEGLDPADYAPQALAEAIAGGEGAVLDEVASRAFAWLVEDLRDGRTPMEARRQWFILDPDAERTPTATVMAAALASGDIAGALAALHPLHPDYAALRAELASTPASAQDRRLLIRANMDRWRWLPRELGGRHLITNVPEYQLRLVVNGRTIRTYRTIVGARRTPTPQLAHEVEAVIFNPNWTVPQSIVVGEGLGNRVLNNPAWARANGYTATRAANGRITVVQAPGPGNALGLMKLDMPNDHAIFLHDTPNRELFNRTERALSHGCIRTERALELAMTVVMLGGGATREEAVAASSSGRYTRVPIQQRIPVYITYFTLGVDIEGKLTRFEDIYGRDAPVIASLSAPRVANRTRLSAEAIVPIENPGL